MCVHTHKRCTGVIHVYQLRQKIDEVKVDINDIYKCSFSQRIPILLYNIHPFPPPKLVAMCQCVRLSSLDRNSLGANYAAVDDCAPAFTIYRSDDWVASCLLQQWSIRVHSYLPPVIVTWPTIIRYYYYFVSC